MLSPSAVSAPASPGWPLANRTASDYTHACGSAVRRDAGAVERGGLENRCTRERTEGSNPSPSANHLKVLRLSTVRSANAAYLPNIAHDRMRPRRDIACRGRSTLPAFSGEKVPAPRRCPDRAPACMLPGFGAGGEAGSVAAGRALVPECAGAPGTTATPSKSAGAWSKMNRASNWASTSPSGRTGRCAAVSCTSRMASAAAADGVSTRHIPSSSSASKPACAVTVSIDHRPGDLEPKSGIGSARRPAATARYSEALLCYIRSHA
jgi:Tfp pilus assembly major pilin PilA